MNLSGIEGPGIGKVSENRGPQIRARAAHAIAPATKSQVKLPVSVTTVAGTATSSTSFSMTACVVPKLADKKLKVAKKKLKKAECKTGKVTKEDGVTAKTGKVVGQSPKPGRTLAPGTKIKITLG